MEPCEEPIRILVKEIGGQMLLQRVFRPIPIGHIVEFGSRGSNDLQIVRQQAIQIESRTGKAGASGAPGRQSLRIAAGSML